MNNTADLRCKMCLNAASVFTLIEVFGLDAVMGEVCERDMKMIRAAVAMRVRVKADPELRG